MIFDKCSKCDCGKAKVIVNKHFYLCEEKNKERLESKKNIEVKITKIQDKYFDKKRVFIKKVSEKQKSRVDLIKEVYNEIKNEREHKCCCCNNLHITHSHIIPRSRRKDLEVDKENILYDCMYHHNIWEHGTLEQKLEHISNFKERMDYIKRVDIEYYNLLSVKWQKESI